MKNYCKRYGNEEVQAIIFGVTLGHSFALIAESMGRSARGVSAACKRALKIKRWQQYQNEIKLKYGVNYGY